MGFLQFKSWVKLEGERMTQVGGGRAFMGKHLHYGFHLVLCLGLPVLHMKLKAEAQPGKGKDTSIHSLGGGNYGKKMALWE